ncbi:MAG TPA: hypothetical protein VME69_16210 [Methylocella sp.]|nr:hypothetical protein [Methylocella sp.]
MYPDTLKAAHFQASAVLAVQTLLPVRPHLVGKLWRQRLALKTAAVLARRPGGRKMA